MRPMNLTMSTGCRLCLYCVVVILSAHSHTWAVVTETFRLVPEDPQVGSFFGNNVTIGGGMALVGSPKSDAGGAAYVFDASTGTQLFKFAPNDVFVGDRFGGGALAISNGLAYIGGARDTSGTAAIWVFDLTNGNQVAKWTPEDVDASTTFGTDIAIMGNRAIVGAPSTDVSGIENAGTAYLLDLTTGNQIAKLVSATPQILGSFGSSVAIDGNYAAVFASGNNDRAVSLFDALTGSAVADFPGPGLASAGSSLAISADRLLLGTANILPGENGVRLYDITDPLNTTFTTIPWPQLGSGQFFGKSVALSNDAMLVSTWFSDEILASGIVHMFDPDTGNLLESFRSSDASEDDQFGWSIGLDGQTLIVGAPGEPTTTGAAYLFTIPEPSTLACFAAGLALMFPRRRRPAISDHPLDD